MLDTPRPGYYRRYPSKAVSDYYIWFLELGYPQLDIVKFADGEWAIIEYMNTPIVPALTKFKTVLSGLRNMEIQFDFVRKMVLRLDPTRREFHAMHADKSQKVHDEHAALERHRQDSVERAYLAIKKNEALMDRIAREGLSQMNLWNIRKHIPGYREPWKERPWLM